MLSAHSNHLSSWAGLSGLSALRDLNLKDNYLGSQTGSVVPLPTSLQNLQLDANGLTNISSLGGAEEGVEPQSPPSAEVTAPLPQLRFLGLAHNELRSPGEGH